MTDITKTLLRKTSLRKACKELSLAEMEKLQSNLDDLIEEHKAEEAQLREAQKEKEKKLAEVRKAMAQAGISLEELDAAIGGSKPKKTQGTVAPKYQIEDANGKVHQWTGRGRTPKVFQEYFDQGGNREDCLI